MLQRSPAPQPTLRRVNPVACYLADLLTFPPALLPCRNPTQGLEIGVGLLSDFGPVVCKFGPEALKPVLKQTIGALLKQTPQQLARLPQLADALANVDPKILAVSDCNTFLPTWLCYLLTCLRVGQPG
jgi:hypothetical protein